MKYKKPVSIGRLRKIYKLCTGITAWTPILRRLGRRYNPTTLKRLRENNIKAIIKDIREWLDEASSKLK